MKTTGEAVCINVDEAVDQIVNAKNIIIVPGYGLAVAKAQYAIAELTKSLRDHGVQVLHRECINRLEILGSLRYSPCGRPHAWPAERAAR